MKFVVVEIIGRVATMMSFCKNKKKTHPLQLSRYKEISVANVKKMKYIYVRW